MRSARKAWLEIFDNPVLIGAITILVASVAVYLSYIAENGLPFLPTYNVKVDVANGDELTKNADVRIGGAHVGQVLKITPEPAAADPNQTQPFTRLTLSLQKSLEPLPYNTTYEIRLASVLGGKYVELFPGTDKNTPQTPALADGGTFQLGGKLNRNVPIVDIDQAFKTFGPRTQQGLRNTTSELGDWVAGRGTQFNDAVYNLHQLIGPLDRLLGLFASPSTHLAQFISGAAATTGALAHVAPTFSALLSDGAVTFRALTNSNLAETIDQLPGTEAAGTTVLTNAEPVLADAATLVQALKPGAALLPVAVDRLDAILTAATPVFKRVPELASRLQTALHAVERFAHDPASTESFKLLGSSDLATFGASGFVGLGAILHAIAPAQLACNVAGNWIANFASEASEGDAAGTWLRFAPLIDPTLQLSLLASKPDPRLHVNFHPIENSSQCQAGNEGYTPGQLIGNPPPTTTKVPNTTAPAVALARGRSVGLVP